VAIAVKDCIYVILRTPLDAFAFRASNGKNYSGLWLELRPSYIILFSQNNIRCCKFPHRCADSPQLERGQVISEFGEVKEGGARSNLERLRGILNQAVNGVLHFDGSFCPFFRASVTASKRKSSQ
jgi:hypothetical protein